MILLFPMSCGFSPLYYKTGIRDNKIFVNTIPEAMGQKLRFELSSRLSPSGFPKNPDYYLDVALEKKIYEKQGLLQDSTSSRYTLQIIARFSLRKNGSVVFKDSMQMRSSYDILYMPYATQSSAQTAEDNIIMRLADSIALRIDVYLKDKNETAKDDKKNKNASDDKKSEPSASDTP